MFGPGRRLPTARPFALSRISRARHFHRLRSRAVRAPPARNGARRRRQGRQFRRSEESGLGAGAKANHLSYIGDASVGEKANIGAGTITCNYDGFGKYRTEIGAGAFIGSNSALVAPVVIGAGAIVGAGSVVTKNVAADELAIARGEQKGFAGWAARFGRGNRRRRTRSNMCGIVGIVGREAVAQRLFDGLKRFEYRGYDSAGICTVQGGEFERRRAEGKLDNLARVLAAAELHGDTGLRILAGRHMARRRSTMPIRTSPGRWRWSTTASSRISSRCATS